jgi:hypothetical protein
MSHGEAWLKTSVLDVARELNQGNGGKPAHTAIMSIKSAAYFNNVVLIV